MKLTFIEWLRHTREEYDRYTRKSSFHIVDCWGGRIVKETLSNVTKEQAYNHPTYLNGGAYMFIEEIKQYEIPSDKYIIGFDPCNERTRFLKN